MKAYTSHCKPRHWSRVGIMARTALAALAMTTTLAGCSINDLVDVPDPSNILDPGAVKSPNGAISLYNGAMTGFLQIFNGSKNSATMPFSIAGGLLSDEYTSPGAVPLDQRTTLILGSDDASFTWRNMSTAYLNTDQAIQYLKAYAPAVSPQYLAKAYMAKGYMELFLSELFCSGVPLSQAAADGSTIMGKPLSREELQRLAIAHFDSAISIVEPDSARIINSAKMGRARAFLNLKEYDNAVTAMAGIPTSFRYNMQYTSSISEGSTYFQSWTWETVSDNEGINGLNYVSARDPRLVLDSVSNINGYGIWVVHNFRTSGNVDIPLASGINARLIEAEVQLSKGDTPGWLLTLNTLRTSCTSAGSCATPAPAGTGGVAGLPLLTDPGTTDGRLMLMFRERAFWLFGQGYRQGDLRRLIRQYQIPQSRIYPTGPYDRGFQYGTEVTATPGGEEVLRNPNYAQGCFDREA